jgi:protein arginine kinase activator
MLCQDCHKLQAVVHIKQVVNNQEVVLALCKECAERRGFSDPLGKTKAFPLADFLSSMVGETGAALPEKLAETTCPECGLTYREFAQTGKLGCGSCFEAYRRPLSDLLRRIHGSTRHLGKRHSGSDSAMEPLKEEARIKDELRQAIEAEDFERAAHLRDTLKEVRRRIHASDV